MKRKTWLIIGGVVIGLAILGDIFNATPAGKQAAKEQETQDSLSAIKQKSVNDSTLIAKKWDKLKIEAFIYAKHFCEQKLKAPSSAEFGNIWDEHCGVFSDDDTDANGTLTSFSHKPSVTVPNKVTFRVINYVDAQNSFGAKIRNWYRVNLYYDEKSNTWTLEKIYLGENLN